MNGILCSTVENFSYGGYFTIELSLEDSKDYKLTSREMPLDFGSDGPVQTKSEVLAEGLECNIDGFLAYCFKSGAPSGEASNSFVTFTLVERTAINDLNQPAPEKSSAEIEIEVFSPLISKLEKFRFQAELYFLGLLKDCTKL